MTRYLLDTNVLSEARKPRPHGAVIAWLNSQPADRLVLSAVSMGELQAGIEKTKRQNRAKADEIELWVEQVAKSYEVLPMDTPCFREWGRIMNGKSDELYEDAMIAATARVYGLTIATRNEHDFRHFDVRVFNPFRS